MYGSWEATLYNGNYEQSPEDINKLRKKELTYYNPETNKLEKESKK